MDDLEERVFGTLPDETWVYPGHGDDTTWQRASIEPGVAGPRMVARYPAAG